MERRDREAGFRSTPIKQDMKKSESKSVSHQNSAGRIIYFIDACFANLPKGVPPDK
jgi:hypothetical protein